MRRHCLDDLDLKTYEPMREFNRIEEDWCNNSKLRVAELNIGLANLKYGYFNMYV